MKYMKQGSGKKYDEGNPSAPRKAPSPGWISYEMNEAESGVEGLRGKKITTITVAKNNRFIDISFDDGSRLAIEKPQGIKVFK